LCVSEEQHTTRPLLRSTHRQSPAASGPATRNHHLRPFNDQSGKTERSRTSQKYPQPFSPLRRQFDSSAHCSSSASVMKEINHCGREDAEGTLAPPVVLKQKRNDVVSRTTGSCRRISLRVAAPFAERAKKSSIDSSSGFGALQDLPTSALQK